MKLLEVIEDCGINIWVMGVMVYFQSHITDVINAPSESLGDLTNNEQLMDILASVVRGEKVKVQKIF